MLVLVEKPILMAAFFFFLMIFFAAFFATLFSFYKSLFRKTGLIYVTISVAVVALRCCCAGFYNGFSIKSKEQGEEFYNVDKVGPFKMQTKTDGVFISSLRTF